MNPVYHELKYVPGHYDKVYWPTQDGQVTIKTGTTYTRPNGVVIKVEAIFEGKMYPMVSYSINDGKRVSTSLSWFAHNIANTKK